MSYPRYPKYKDSGVDWLAEVPEGWDVKPIYSVGFLRNGFPFKSVQFCSEGTASDRVLRIRDLLGDDEKIYSQEICPENAYISDGDILIGMDGDFNVHFWRRGRSKLNQRMCALVAETKTLTMFFYFLLSIPLKSINDITFSTTVKHLSSYDILHTKIALPAETETQKIVLFLDRETAKIDALVAEQEKLITLLAEKRQAVISHAVTKGLNPNAPMKDSGVEWLGEVPEGWDCVLVKRVSQGISTGGTPSSEAFDCEGQDDIPWYTPGDFQENLYLPISEVRKVAISNADKVKTFPKNSVLVIGIGATLGKVGIASTECSSNQQINCIIPRSEMIKYTFLAYSLRSQKQQLLFNSNAATLGIMNQEKTGSNKICLPLLIEQQAIVDYLDTETAKIDALIAEAQKAVDLLKERSSALISAAVTGKIDVRDIPVQEAV